MTKDFEKRNAEIADLRKKGMKLKEIADAYGISRERIRQICIKEKRKEEKRNNGELDTRLSNRLYLALKRAGILTEEELFHALENEPYLCAHDVGEVSRKELEEFTHCKIEDMGTRKLRYGSGPYSIYGLAHVYRIASE